tara:strand:+ start:63 stop:269 length:207 start_codon:yes stop_codon:yes gene_type:complete
MIYNKNKFHRENNDSPDFYDFTSNPSIYNNNKKNLLRHEKKEKEKIERIGIIDMSNLEKSISKAMKNS